MNRVLRAVFFSIFFMLLFVGSIRADSTAPIRKVLDNGMIVLINEMPASPVTAIYAWVKTGSATEAPLIGSGVTHFVEHMLFKGTERRGPGVIPEEVRALGGSINAATGHDYTVFTLSLPSENFAQGLDLIADMMQAPQFDSLEVEKERQVILKEMHMINDRPERRLSDLQAQTLYLVHPYRHPIIGYERIFKTITRDQLFSYYKDHYAPNNIILSLSGGIKASDVLPLVERAFGSFEPRPTPQRILPLEPDQITPRTAAIEYPTELFRGVMSYQGMPLLHHDLFAMDVLAMALGIGHSSRLHQELYEKRRLVESVYAVNDTPIDRGSFDIGFTLRSDAFNEVVTAVDAVIDQVKVTGLRKDELDKVKRNVLAQNVYARETAEGMAHRAAMEEAFTGDASFSNKYLEGVRRVTNEDIKRVAALYFNPDRRSIVVMKPLSVLQDKDPEEKTALTSGSTQIVTLRNGVRLLLMKDASLPLVNVRAMMRGGRRQDPDGKLGLGNLTAKVWSKGVKGKSAAFLYKEIEGVAGSLGVGAGFDSFGIDISVLADDQGLAYENLELLLKYPLFPQDEIEKEKADVLTELEARKDSLVQVSFRALKETLFDKHPWRRDSLGTAETIARISRADLLSFYQASVVPEQMVIAIYGDIDPKAVAVEMERRFGDIKPRAFSVVTEDEPLLTESRLRELTMNKEQTFVAYGFRGPHLSDNRRYALEVGVNALSSSLGGRLFRRIRDELGKAYALSGFCASEIDTGMCAFYVLTTEENIAKVQTLIEEELRAVMAAGFTEKEIADAKSFLKADFARDYQAVSARAGRDAANELFGFGYAYYHEYDVHINAVTAGMVQDAVRMFLDPSHAAVVVTHAGKQ